jgi:hypothetical protein
MDYNKDLTMESDFEGMFNYPAGRHNNNHNIPIDPADITKAVNNYLEEHPVEGIENMTKAEMLDILRGGEN